MIQSTQDLTVNKLIILLLLKNVKKGIKQTELTEFVLYKNYTDYFSLQQYVSELVSAKLINYKKLKKSTIYTINSKGVTTLELFSNRIPYSIRQEISDFTKDNQLKINHSTKVTAEINKTDDNLFVVDCLLKESGKTILNTFIKTSSEDEALAIRMNWENKAINIYKDILSELNRK